MVVNFDHIFFAEILAVQKPKHISMLKTIKDWNNID